MNEHPTIDIATETAQRAAAQTSKPGRRWPLFLAGLLVFLAGPAIYTVQFLTGHLQTPWHVPILASVGVVLMMMSAWQRRGILRIAGLVLFLLLCGFEWYFVAAASKAPAYTGPVQADRKIPEFTTTLADGKMFTDKDLVGDKPEDKSTLLVFFRGRW